MKKANVFVNGLFAGELQEMEWKMLWRPIAARAGRAAYSLAKGVASLRKGRAHSYYEGKTRLYHFNQSYALISEVE